MGRIKIQDIPIDKKLTAKEFRTIYGGPTRRMESFGDPVGYSMADNFQQYLDAVNLFHPLSKP